MGRGNIPRVRRDPAFVVLGMAIVAVGAVLIPLAWPGSLPPDCSDPPHLGAGETLIDGDDCINDPAGDAVRAFLPVAGSSLLVAVGFAAAAYGVRRHPS
jgi:hypothetical protein